MSTENNGDLVRELARAFPLLMETDKQTGVGKIVNLVAYGSDLENKEATLIFVESGYMDFQEIRLAIPFEMFDSIIEENSRLSLRNIEKEPVRVDLNSALGRAVADYKANIANMLYPSAPGVFH